ncbi:MAG: RusA family crossover junction endodeoxyribonuclease [FCB group bacterium]|nr:RusA family crossover junction endodeoxyribonuclease [FCB group bacterium]
MNDIKLVFPGLHAQKRHRLSGRRMYDPSVNDKIEVAILTRTQLPSDWKMFEGEPLLVALRFYVQRPQNHYRANGKLKSWAPVFCYSRPDIDNYIKLYLDAMAGIVYKDDGLVAVITAGKPYGDKPETQINIGSLNKEAAPGKERLGFRIV